MSGGALETVERTPICTLSQTLRPIADSGRFRDAMASMGATACLATARFGAERLGRTVTSVFSLSADPPAILVSIDLASRLAERIARTGGFSFAILSEGQQQIADAFAGRRDPDCRFEAGRWLSWKSGHPRLEGAVAAMDCEVTGAMETGSHVLFAGGVVDIEVAPELAPLIWHRRRYGRIA